MKAQTRVMKSKDITHQSKTSVSSKIIRNKITDNNQQKDRLKLINTNKTKSKQRMDFVNHDRTDKIMTATEEHRKAQETQKMDVVDAQIRVKLALKK